MTISDMLSQSVLLTLLGMAVVFSFLIIMILAMHLLHGVVHALRLDKDKENNVETKTSAPVQVESPAVDNGAVVAAIAAAVRERQSV
ncbi:MAG: OadG family protein [Treponema sp.]|nr:OadG family protein [Treponema sp.]